MRAEAHHRRGGSATLICALLALTLAGVAGAQTEQQARLAQEGGKVYGIYCVGCHGEKGDGNGPAARLLIVKPRDFTRGIFKFRTTPSGSMPTDEDLYRTITRGVFRTSMPEHALVPERQRLAVIQYIKTFSERWTTEAPGQPIPIPGQPEDLGSDESVARGKVLYEMLECWTCHGKSGRGDGPSAATLQPDEWGNPQKPFNFTKGWLKGGPSPRDIYRTFMTGLNGTAMPSYQAIFDSPDGENIKEGDAWRLISFVLSLREKPAASPESRVADQQK